MMHDPPSPDAVLRGILESAQDLVIFALDRQYRYLAFNRAHARTMKVIWGVDIALGQCMLDCIGRVDDRVRAEANFSRALRGEVFTLVEAYGDTARGRREYEDVYSPIRSDDGDVVGLSVFVRDVTDARRQARELERYRQDLELLLSTRSHELEETHRALRREIEERLRVETKMQQTQRLESLGTASGSMAHDINNVLMGILGNAELALGLQGLPADATAHLEIIAEAAESAASLTHKVFEYSGAERDTRRRIDLGALVDEMRSLLSLSVPAAVRLEFRLAGTPLQVVAEPHRLHQLVMNLVTNAAEACEGEVGLVRIRTGEAKLPGPTGLLWPAVAGDYALLEVADNGRGIAADALDRIFDPFYSTRVAGRGLGLSAVQSIIRSANGTCSVESEPGEGTCFRVYLPMRAVTGAPPEDARGSSRGGRVSPGSRGTALVADDAPRCLEVVSAMLREEGFEILTATDGATCLRLFHDAEKPIALACIDLSMPGMGGVRALEHLRDVDPGLPAIVMSGYAEFDVLARLGHLQQVQCVIKPFRRREFVRALDKAMRARSS